MDLVFDEELEAAAKAGEASFLAAGRNRAQSTPNVPSEPARPEQKADRLAFTAERAAAEVAQAQAVLLLSIDAAVAFAHENPDVYSPVGPQTAERDEFVERAVVGDLALRLHMSEYRIRGMVREASVLRTKLPYTYSSLRAGQVSYASAQVLVDQVQQLPEDLDPEVLQAYDWIMSRSARALTTAALKAKAKRHREEIHSMPAGQRHAKAAEERRTFIEIVDDGMAWLSLYTTATDALRAEARIDANARRIAADPDSAQGRTLAQIRADAAADLLTGEGTEYEVTTHVNIEVPVLTLAGESTDPAMLEGRVPIDVQTAKRLIAKAPYLRRLLTDPIRGIRLTMDEGRYRPSKDQRRLLESMFHTCGCPGCNRPARACDIDHILDWLYGGKTEIGNLVPLCRKHHREKHHTRIQVTPGSHPGEIIWVTATGYQASSDPPF
jgi:hypothetical protein